MKTFKTKLLAMLMAVVMVFAMAPLATGIAFADEEGVDAVEVTDVVNDTEEAEPQLEAAEAVDKGDLVIDLSNGPVTYQFNPSEGIMNDVMNMIMMASTPNPFCDPWLILLSSIDDPDVMYLDLDDDGSMDVKFTAARPDNHSSPTAVTLEPTSYRSVQTSITIKTPPEMIEYFKADPDEAQYYSSMTFVLGKEKVKAANTLAIKGKTAKIKYKKLKKKNQTLKLSKVITLTNAGQGAVTYAKAKGNKKIKVAKNGKVTVKKKLKKGTYKVTVNVTAAGNDDYNGITKTVTFKVKVK